MSFRGFVIDYIIVECPTNILRVIAEVLNAGELNNVLLNSDSDFIENQQSAAAWSLTIC